MRITKYFQKVLVFLLMCSILVALPGSYTCAAVYTNQLDFSDWTPLDITIEGVFGLADSDGTVISEPQN